jgi:cytochrome c peroxidase
MTSSVRRIAILASLGVASMALSDAPAFVVPKGLPQMLWDVMVPADNPVTPAKIELGRRLYFDKRLSSDGTVSCASCHDPEKGFADGRAVAEGVGGQKGGRNSPTVLNAAFNEVQFWDGRAGSLEEQAKGPFVNPIEMGMKDHDAVTAVVRKDAAYVADFQAVFGGAPTIDRIAAAIATFERTVVSGNSDFDRFRAGDETALSESAQRGWRLWNGRAKCHLCHPFSGFNPNLSDNKFHNIGVSTRKPGFEALAKRAAAGAVQPPSSPTTSPFTQSIFSACGCAGSPGMRMISPSSGTTNPAPAESTMRRTVMSKSRGRLTSADRPRASSASWRRRSAGRRSPARRSA